MYTHPLVQSCHNYDLVMFRQVADIILYLPYEMFCIIQHINTLRGIIDLAQNKKCMVYKNRQALNQMVCFYRSRKRCRKN